jgi:hypothetical protein
MESARKAWVLMEWVLKAWAQREWKEWVAME